MRPKNSNEKPEVTVIIDWLKVVDAAEETKKVIEPVVERPKAIEPVVRYIRLRCPACNSKRTQVQNTKPRTGDIKIRYHKCSDCGHTFKSVEFEDYGIDAGCRRDDLAAGPIAGQTITATANGR